MYWEVPLNESLISSLPSGGDLGLPENDDAVSVADSELEAMEEKGEPLDLDSCLWHSLAIQIRFQMAGVLNWPLFR